MKNWYSVLMWITGAALLGFLLALTTGCAGNSGNAEGPARTRKTEVVVIGTVHQPTEVYDGELLYSILQKLRPAVILTELPPAFYNEDYSLKDFEGGMETRTARRYAERNGAQLRPYDIEGRNQFYRDQNWFERNRAFMKEVRLLYRDQALSEAGMRRAKEMYAAYELRDAFRDQPPRVINSAACDRVVRIKQKVTRESWRYLAEHEPQLAEHRDYVRLRGEYWQRRNRRMVENIVRWAGEYPRSRVVVLTGFEHAYFLRQGLGEQAAGAGFDLKYHWKITRG